MIDNINNLVLIFSLIVGIMMVLLLVLVFIFFYSKWKNKSEKEETIKSTNPKETKSKLALKEYSTDSIFNFMEFDKIEDNMIVQKNGDKYLMVVECQGINYDLMSEPEQVAVEEGFLQFLNTLTHPIQIYTQTRTVNLESSIITYKEKVREIELKLDKQKMEYEQMKESGTYTQEQINRAYFELTKQTNLYEYGKDIIYNTEKMSLNKNVLNKRYYVIVPYYPADLGQNEFDKEEIKNLAFSELYTKCQSIIRTLGACEISGKVLNSIELVELLYIAYNRDDAEIFGIDKALQAGYNELYITAPDVLDKKMRALDKQIEDKALEKANEKVLEAKTEKQRMIEQKEETMEDLVDELAKLIISQNRTIVGKDIAKMAIDDIEKEQSKKAKGGTKDVSKEKKTRGRRTTKTA